MYYILIVQVWQWIRHGTKLEDGNGKRVTYHMVQDLMKEFCEQQSSSMSSDDDRTRLEKASNIFQIIVIAREFPKFITTYLSSESAFLESVKFHT